MGLFDFFKKKKSPEATIRELEHARDFGTISKILSENDLISAPKDNNHNSLGEDLQHLTADGELPWGWVSYNKQFVSQQEEKIDSKWKAVYTAASTKEKLDAFKKYFDTVTKVGEFCKNSGECHYKWFCEHILDSCWYNDHIQDYRKLKRESPDLIKRENLLANLETNVMVKLQECNGILQSDFLKTFDPLIKDDVSSFLREADRSGKIKRTKSGRSYKLEIQ